MTQPHIISSFDRDLEAVQALLMRMGGLVESAILDAAEALEMRDEGLALKVRDGDKAIDALEQQIHSECARLLALRAPTASDLRIVLTVMRVAAALERCGDYAKNLAKRSLILAHMSPLGGTTGSVCRMAKTAVLRLKDSLDAFIGRDKVLAADIRDRDRDIDQMYNSLFRELLTHMLEDPRAISPAMHLHFIAKNIERVGDHATSVAEQVIFLVTGEVPEEERPKADATATTSRSTEE
ncbi:phosphate signaling complex protein PhoU [Rhodobacteraceae bacterium HSP-20]|uniref:Phosphate-specific transport system accessory protein PhoU n=1 Tax=Paragemmobacter amnigenus TaxID=2852097 RepID=A0ABS6J8U3_9RHOB|nr:phosphate signaling complex protein PhoU [Rhodobacter amnigenus]MBU9700163.1 phosphate signaling complex protein PhoU [Rhodobacter amnigenus]MBV4391390.1 phosphate signaling complex protein PhoU [Rhodobacter amnigenus]